MSIIRNGNKKMLDKLYWVLSIDNEVKMNWRAKGKLLCSVGHKAALGAGWVGGTREVVVGEGRRDQG